MAYRMCSSYGGGGGRGELTFKDLGCSGWTFILELCGLSSALAE